MKIHALAIREPGGTAQPFVYERSIGRRDVLVRITHRSLARGDVQYIDNAWGDTRFPLVPCHEIVGLIEDAGQDVAHLRRGDRVGVGYQQDACFECRYCTQGIEQLCARQKVIAVDCYGGLATHIIVDGRFAFQLPSPLESAAAAPLLSSGLTVYAGIVRARLPAGSQVAVLGAGGLGHLAIQFLHKMGHHVTALSQSPSKQGLIERLGGRFVDSSQSQLRNALHGIFDFVLSTLNVPFDLDAQVRLLSPHGQMCLVASPLEPLALNGGLFNNSRRSLFGNYIGSRADTEQMLQFAAVHDVEAVVEIASMSRVNDGIDRIRRRAVEMSLVLES